MNTEITITVSAVTRLGDHRHETRSFSTSNGDLTDPWYCDSLQTDLGSLLGQAHAALVQHVNRHDGGTADE